MVRSRPGPDQVAAAVRKRLRDVIAPDLRVLFCGINPGLYSAAIGHHFGRPGNRFWPALHASGFTPRLFDPSEDLALLDLRLGITNLVPRTTATADQLTTDELTRGSATLRRKLLRYRPRILAMVGLTAYRTAFTQPKAAIGLQPEPIGTTRIWLLPNPSGVVRISDQFGRPFVLMVIATIAVSSSGGRLARRISLAASSCWPRSP